jgi:hypothetical protein
MVATDSEHDGSIFKNLTKGLALERPNQLWIAHLTYVAISPHQLNHQRYSSSAAEET